MLIDVVKTGTKIKLVAYQQNFDFPSKVFEKPLDLRQLAVTFFKQTEIVLVKIRSGNSISVFQVR